MWREYFPAGSIFALDLYDKTPHNQDRVRIFQGSQADPAILRQVAAEIGQIDVVLDDGSHVSQHIITSFEVLFPLLAPGGLYIVEDIGTAYWPDYGGSEDFTCATTSVGYFKRLVGRHPASVLSAHVRTSLCGPACPLRAFLSKHHRDPESLTDRGSVARGARLAAWLHRGRQRDRQGRLLAAQHDRPRPHPGLAPAIGPQRVVGPAGANKGL